MKLIYIFEHVGYEILANTIKLKNIPKSKPIDYS